MKLLVAVNEENIENYLQKINNLEYLDSVLKNPNETEKFKDYLNNIGNIEVCCIVKHSKNILESVVTHEPDTILISSQLPGENSMNEIISKLQSKRYPSARIVFLYGGDDSKSKEFINFLISNGVFDYYIGDKLDISILNNLLMMKRTRDDVRCDIVSGIATPKESVLQEHTNESNVVEDVYKNRIKFVQQVVKDLSFEEKRKLGLVEMKENINTVVTDRILGNISIAVCGASEKVGTTHHAFQIAYFLTRHSRKFKVAIAQMNNKKDFQLLNYYGLKKALTDNSFKYKNVDFYYDIDIFTLKQFKVYDYIVLDLGRVKWLNKDEKVEYSEYFDCVRWSNLSILVCHSKPWQFNDLALTLFDKEGKGLDDNIETFNNIEIDKKENKYIDWKLLFNLADDEFYKEVKPYLMKNWDVFKTNYSPDLFKGYEDLDMVIGEILQSVLPKKDKFLDEKSFFSFIKSKVE